MAAASMMLCLCSAAQSGLQQELLGRYKSFTHALQRKDSKFLEGYFAPEFISNLPDGKVAARGDAILALEELAGKATNLRWTWKLSSLTIGSEGATVIAEGVMTMRAQPDGKTWRLIEIAGRTEDTWIRGEKDWQLRRIRWISLSPKMDGKRIDMQNPAP